MKIYTSRDLRIENKKVFYGEEDTGFSAVPNSVYSNMWRVRWPDGILSEDLYNIQRAKEHSVMECLRWYTPDRIEDAGEAVLRV